MTSTETGDTFVLLEPRAELFVRPDEHAASHRFVDRDAADAAADRGAIVLRFMGWHGDQWAAVQTIPRAELATQHCHDRFAALDGWTLDFFVRRDALLPVLTKPFERRFSDGTSIVARAGLRAHRSRDPMGAITHAGTRVAVDLAGAEVGLRYRPSEPFVEHANRGHLQRGHAYAYGDGQSLAAPHCGELGVHSIVVRDEAAWVTSTSRCSQLVLRTTAEALAPKARPKPAAPRPGESRVTAMARNFDDAVAGDGCFAAPATPYGHVTGQYGFLLGSDPHRPRPRPIPAGTTVALEDGTRLGRTRPGLEDTIVDVASGCTEHRIADQRVCYAR